MSCSLCASILVYIFAPMPYSRSRYRKVAILTLQGFQKLQTAISQSKSWNQYTKTCSLEALSEQTGLSPQTLSKVHAQHANVDLRTLVRYFNAFNLTLDTSDYLSPPRSDKALTLVPDLPTEESSVSASAVPGSTLSWDTAPDVSVFYGRTTELTTLRHWVVEQRCRLVTLIGMAGMGKTWLATKLAEQVQHQFQAVVWRSLQPLGGSSRRPRPFHDLVDDLIQHLAPQPERPLPETSHAKIRHLLDCLRQTRCLLVLDHVESVLPGGDPLDTIGHQDMLINQSAYEDYDALLRYLSQGRHQSCVLLTSREEPKRMQQLSGDRLAIRVLPLQGLPLADAQPIFRARGVFQCGAVEWSQLIHYYGGNPLMLEMVATMIQQLFAGSVAAFLSQHTLIFDEIRELLDQQFDCLSHPEQAVINVLANQDTHIGVTELRSYLSPKISATRLLAALKSLKTRCLLEETAVHFSLPPLLKDYIRARHSTHQIVTYAVGDRLAM